MINIFHVCLLFVERMESLQLSGSLQVVSRCMLLEGRSQTEPQITQITAGSHYMSSTLLQKCLTCKSFCEDMVHSVFQVLSAVKIV